MVPRAGRRSSDTNASLFKVRPHDHLGGLAESQSKEPAFGVRHSWALATSAPHYQMASISLNLNFFICKMNQ